MIKRLPMLFALLSLAACGVQGDLYRPEEPRPAPRAKSQPDALPNPFPERPPEEQEIMPDMY